MRDSLPKKARAIECGVVNHDKKTGEGTHWTAYKIENGSAVYFDSFGNLRPPPEVVEYLNSSQPIKIHYNYDRKQKYNSFNCGHLVLEFLFNNTPPLNF